VVVAGEGLMLNDRQLGKFECIHFRGEDQIFCKPLQRVLTAGEAPNPVVDFGVIYQRNHFLVEMKFHELGAGAQEPTRFSTPAFMFCAFGELTVSCKKGEIHLTFGDCLQIESGEELKIESPTNAKWVLVSFERLNSTKTV
jgi:mannose-6-phosphate isomerase-like protein (cupin superfamily)